jgi:hypothetical protein
MGVGTAPRVLDPGKAEWIFNSATPPQTDTGGITPAQPPIG